VAITDNTVLRVMFSNPKGLKLSTDILETEHSFGRVHSLNTGLFGLAETNVNWRHPRVLGKFHKSLRKVWKHTALSTSSTKDDFQSEIQPGGTITLACGHWTLRVLQKGVDPFGLGRWSYLTLRGNQGRKILLITAYRVCRQSIQLVRPKTSAAQQFRHLSKTFCDAGLEDDQVPRHQFLVDLQAWIEKKVDEGYFIILGIDANEQFSRTDGSFTPVQFSFDKPIRIKGHDGTLSTLVCTCGLIDLLTLQHPDPLPPATYIRGKERIDFIFVSAALLPNVRHTGILPYNSIFISDHCPCYIDFDSKSLFA